MVSGEFCNFKVSGTPPAPRFGHTMAFLPTNNSLAIVGGRNDELSVVSNSPFLNEIYLFLLDQKCWLAVKYSVFSNRMDFTTNHSMAVVTDNESFEKILVFGGLANKIDKGEDKVGKVESCLCNQSYVI